jgi:hypothetical protein
MDVELPDGRIIEGVPDGITQSELLRRLAAHDARERQSSPEFQARVAQQQAEDRERYDPTRDMNPFELAAANLGAGYGGLTMGLQQLLSKAGLAPPVSDEEILEKRARDELLAQALPYAGRMYQLIGEVGPTMVVPGAAYGRAVQFVPGVAQAGRATQLLAAGAAGGAAGAALTPTTSDESRGGNMAAAAGIGAVIPGAGMAGPAVVRGTRKLLTESGAQQRALETIADHLPDGGRALLDRLGAYKSPTLKGQPVEVPISAAQASGDARLAQLEAASRSRPNSQPDWADFDAAQNAQRFELLKAQTPSELRLDRLDRARDLASSPMREAALREAGQVADIAAPVTRKAQDLIEGATGANPAVANVARYVARELGEDAAGAVTPARMYEVRKVLASKLSGPSAIGDELAASAKGAARETRAMIQAIDDALEGASGGQWTPYLQEYAQRSRPVTSGRAQRDVLERIEAKPLRGSTPEITAAGYGTAMRQATQGKFGDKLTEAARSDADAFLDHLRQAESVSRTRKAAATMGGGSITNTDQQLARLAARAIEGAPVVGGYAKRIREFNAEQVDRELARLLQYPSELAPRLRELLDSGTPTQKRAFLDEMARASGLAGAAQVTP